VKRNAASGRGAGDGFFTVILTAALIASVVLLTLD
jgi:hypothetical protein